MGESVRQALERVEKLLNEPNERKQAHDAYTRPRLLKLLSTAEEVLTEAETLPAELPVGREDKRKALSLLPELRETVRRVQQMLSEPDDGK